MCPYHDHLESIHKKCSSTLPTKYYWALYEKKKKNASCLHVRIQWDNTSKNNKNFETLQMYEHLLHTNIGLSNSKEAIFT